MIQCMNCNIKEEDMIQCTKCNIKEEDMIQYRNCRSWVHQRETQDKKNTCVQCKKI